MLQTYYRRVASGAHLHTGLQDAQADRTAQYRAYNVLS